MPTEHERTQNMAGQEETHSLLDKETIRKAEEDIVRFLVGKATQIPVANLLGRHWWDKTIANNDYEEWSTIICKPSGTLSTIHCESLNG